MGFSGVFTHVQLFSIPPFVLGHVTLFAYGQTGSGKTHTIFGSDSDMGLYQSTCQDIIRRLEQEKADEDETLSRKRMASSSSTSSTSNIISAFATSRTSPTPSSAVLTVQFFEIYSSRVYDLFNNRKRLDLLEDGKGYVQVVGLREIEVDSLAKFVELVEIGRRVRTTGKSMEGGLIVLKLLPLKTFYILGVTEANSTSSRSHAVFQITIYQDESRMAGSSVDRRKYVTSQGIEMRLKGQFSFVDLAGSERGKETGNINRQARMEGAEINKSLLALKECIRALHRQTTAPSSSTNSTSPNISTISSSASPHLDVSGGGSSFGEYYLTSEPFQQQQQRQHHIPFRGSKLTQILRDSFTGRNSKTVMIATVGPGSNSAEHTLNTLRYADRVKELEKKGVNNGNSGGGSKRSKSSYVSRDDDDGMLFLVDDDERNRSSASGGREGKGFGGGVSTAAVTTTRSNSRRDKDVAIVGGRRSKHSSSLSRKNESSSGGGGGSVTVTSGITSGLNMRKSASAVSSSQDQIPGDDSSNTTTGSSSSSSEGHSEADDERPDGRDKEELLLDDEEADAVDYDDEEEEEVEEEEEEDSPLERHHEDDFAHHHSPQQQQQHILSSFDTGGGIISSSPNNKGHSKKDSSGGSSSFSSSSVGATFIKNQQQQQQQQQLLVQGRESLKRSALGGIRKDTERILLESHSKSVSTVLGLLNEEEEALRSVLRGWTSVEEYVGTLRSLLQRRTDETNTLLSLIN